MWAIRLTAIGYVVSALPAAVDAFTSTASVRSRLAVARTIIKPKARISRRPSTSRTSSPRSENESVDHSVRRYLDDNGNLVEPRVYPQRWIQLGCLSALALLSDWVCFSVASAPDTYEAAFQHSAASLVDIFLFTNVASSFLVTDVVGRFGLKRSVQAAAWLMALGSWCRSGLSFIPSLSSAAGPALHLVDYKLMIIGTVLVGAAQPFFQCTPPLLSAKWFAPAERATSTAVALNFNQIGIALAFLVGGSMATTSPGLESYFGLITVLASAVALATQLQFQEDPPVPPSASELEKKLRGEKEPPFLVSVSKFFQTPGFTQALAAFVCSISITNIVGTFIDDILHQGGITDQLAIDLSGAGFELAILLGGIFLGSYVDRTKRYKMVTAACLVVAAITVIPLGLTSRVWGPPAPLVVLLSLWGLGLAVGPVQPINAELAVDVTYPGDETAVESVQQVFGNLVSALLVPVAEFMAQGNVPIFPSVPVLASDLRGDVILLLLIAVVTLQYYWSFNAPLVRTSADSAIVDGEARLEGSGGEEKIVNEEQHETLDKATANDS